MNQANIPGTYAVLGGTVGLKNGGFPVEKLANAPAPPANQ
jgi:hypothetical protein